MRTAVAALIRKDVRLELRTRESVPAMVLFSLGTFVLFHFALDEDEVSGGLASGVLWVTLLFAAVLGINRLFVAEREEGGFDGFLLAPVDRTALFVAKALVLFAFLAAGRGVRGRGVRDPAARAVAVAAAARADARAGARRRRDRRDRDAGRGARRPDPRARPAGAAAGAPALGPAGDRGGERDRATAGRGGRRARSKARWLAILGLYDLVFGLLAYAIFDFLLED